MKGKIWKSALAMMMGATLVIPSVDTWKVQAADQTVVINEIESDDPNGGNDWVEIVNTGSESVDLSGWFVTDDKGLERLEGNKTTPLPAGTVLAPGERLVLEENLNFTFGLGKEDTVTLYDGSSAVVASYSYSGHANGTWSRVPDGTGDFVDQEATKGAENKVEVVSEPGQLVINEINSQPDDWIELMNVGEMDLDISGYEIRDNSDDHRWRFAEGTIVKAGEMIVVDQNTSGENYNDTTGAYEPGTFNMGLGGGDSVRLYDPNGELVDSYTWTEHASHNGDFAAASYGRYPDGTGEFVLMHETKGSANNWYAPEVVINEVESNGDDTDWVEIKNVGSTAIDISGWYLLDNDEVGHRQDITPVAQGTVLNPGEYYVFDSSRDFSFGLGETDQASIYNADGALVARHSWTSHANGVYARIPDGTGGFVDYATSSKGGANMESSPVVINEVESNDPNDGPDWVELANPTSEAIDISGLEIRDSEDDHVYVIAQGTTIPANGYLVIDDLGFGLGDQDSVRLYEDGMMIKSFSWQAHAGVTWGLYPDVNGTAYQNTVTATPGAANDFGIPASEAWPGSGEVHAFDTESTFLEDSSGLDFANGKLYAIDNGTGRFWIYDVARDGTLTLESTKRVRLQKDANDPNAEGPDTEGITVDGNGMVYVASERDNSAKGINDDRILMVDPSTEGEDLVALQEWNLTDSLPDVSANMGIEAVEWISAQDVNGKLVDMNTNAPFDFANYPNATSQGIFFVALEDNGHVYAYVLNQDGSSVQIADLDPKIGGAMALDYDTYEDTLWVVADNGYQNIAATITLNGTVNPEVRHILPPAGLDVNANFEGFAIADASYTVNGNRPVYRFQDGVTSGALVIGSMSCDYVRNYTVTSGDGMEITNGGNLTYVIDEKPGELVSVYLDGALLDASLYQYDPATGTFTIDGEHLADLAVGEHQLILEWADGRSTGSFTITQSDGPANDQSGDHSDQKTENTTPQTGDTTSTSGLAGMMMVSLLGICLVAGRLKKRQE